MRPFWRTKRTQHTVPGPDHKYDALVLTRCGTIMSTTIGSKLHSTLSRATISKKNVARAILEEGAKSPARQKKRAAETR